MPKKEVVDHSTTDANCIVMLTDAEKRARGIIDAAKKRKQALLKKAKDESTAEIDKFRKEHEENVAKLQKQYSTGQDTDALKIDKDLEVKKIDLRQAFKANGQATLKHILEIILNVEPKVHENLII
ncbi:unnamed protein product [Brachionus calyciflorus]|uniref:V-type proton ATPase subunit G n=1 Tax=Brachionus calyciflorus TaxID=104777 RepID=A0A814HQM1_9BILA|nr:unnamed protein product [Brachionus calyciflorus]